MRHAVGAIDPQGLTEKRDAIWFEGLVTRSDNHLSVPSVLGQLLLRRRARGEGLRPSDDDHGCARVALAEMMVAATVLDFGGLPFELPAMRDAWPVDHEHSK